MSIKAQHIPGQLNVVADKLSRLGQTIQTVISPSSGLSNNMQQVTPASDRPFCHQVQQQVASVRIISTRPHGQCSECTQAVMGRSGCVCIPTSSDIGQSGGEVAGHPVQKDNPDCLRVTKHDLVLGPSSHVQSNSSEPANSTQSADTTLQPDPSQKSDKPYTSMNGS